MQAEPSLLFSQLEKLGWLAQRQKKKKWKQLVDNIHFICVCMRVCRGGGEGLVAVAFQHVAIPQTGSHGSHQSPQLHTLPQILGFQARRDHEVPRDGKQLSLTHISPAGMVCMWVFCSRWVAKGWQARTHQLCVFSGRNFDIPGVQICSFIFLLAN